MWLFVLLNFKVSGNNPLGRNTIHKDGTLRTADLNLFFHKVMSYINSIGLTVVLRMTFSYSLFMKLVLIIKENFSFSDGFL